MTQPPVPADLDLSSLEYLPLMVNRLLSSDTWLLASGDEAKAAVTLWCRAWHQVPAGSLPKDDRLLAALSGAGSKWRKVKIVALRGFVECDDGRLYHIVLCSEALEAHKKRVQWREKKRQQREGQNQNVPQHVPEDIHGDIGKDIGKDTGEDSAKTSPKSPLLTGRDGTSTEAKASGAEAPTLEAEVYRFGREVLGKGCGGQITKLCKVYRNDYRAVLAVLTQAKAKGSAPEWIAGVIKRNGIETDDLGLPVRERYDASRDYDAMGVDV